MSMSCKVALQKCNEYDFDLVFKSVKKLFELVPPPDFKNKVVLIKPNILYPKKPELAVCTHPVVVGAVIKAFVEGGAAKVLVGESPAIANSTTAAKATGMYDQVINNGGEWVDFSESVSIVCPEGKFVTQFNFATPFTQADIVVSLAKLKTHQFMAYTGAMKNLFGLIIGLEKSRQHYVYPQRRDFGTFLTDLNIAANAQYAVVDAIVGMDGPGGPGSGNPVKLGFLAASDNILATDVACSSIVGYNPHNIVYLEDALNRKKWLNSFEEIQYLGENKEELQNMCKHFKIVSAPSPTLQMMMPKFINFAAKKFFTKTPHFSPVKCKRCGKCVQICPAKIITLTGKNGTAQMTDKTKCLHCFCCHEICSEAAIKLRRF